MARPAFQHGEGASVVRGLGREPTEKAPHTGVGKSIQLSPPSFKRSAKLEVRKVQA